MTTNPNSDTARIFSFPARPRVAVDTRDAAGSVVRLWTRRPMADACVDAWYHAAAIEDEKKAN